MSKIKKKNNRDKFIDSIISYWDRLTKLGIEHELKHLGLVLIEKSELEKLQNLDKIEPGQLISKTCCPICGSKLTIEYGDDIGEISVIGHKMNE